MYSNRWFYAVYSSCHWPKKNLTDKSSFTTILQRIQMIFLQTLQWLWWLNASGQAVNLCVTVKFRHGTSRWVENFLGLGFLPHFLSLWCIMDDPISKNWVCEPCKALGEGWQGKHLAGTYHYYYIWLCAWLYKSVRPRKLAEKIFNPQSFFWSRCPLGVNLCGTTSIWNVNQPLAKKKDLPTSTLATNPTQCHKKWPGTTW